MSHPSSPSADPSPRVRQTHFLGWDRPLLPVVVDQWARRFDEAPASALWDLSDTLVVVPSAHAIARLSALLDDRARRRGVRIRLPKRITVGQLPEHLYRPELPIASDLEQTLAWTSVLRGADLTSLRPLLSVVPAAEPLTPWIDVAATIRRLHADLASSGLSFGDVAAVTDRRDRRRWDLLTELLTRYRDELTGAGRCDPHLARRDAVHTRSCVCDFDVALLGTTDLSDAVVDLLDQIPCDVIAYVAAPPDHRQGYNAYGSIQTQPWLRHELCVDDCQIVPAGDVEDQAAALAAAVAELAPRYRPSDITIGVTDLSQVQPAEIHLQGVGVSTYRYAGWTIGEGPLGSLLSLISDYLAVPTWQQLAALVRHADVHQMLASAVGDEFLDQLDQLLSDHYPVDIDGDLPPAADATYPRAIAVRSHVERWLAAFGPHGSARTGPRSLRQWREPIQTLLGAVYVASQPAAATTPTAGPAQDMTDDAADQRTAAAIARAKHEISLLGELPETLDVVVDGPQAIEMLRERLKTLRIADRRGPEDVEILGWLDLTLDDAPALIVCGLNHPFVPEATTHDPFLPGSLRTQLKMVDNDRRFARDLAALQVLLSSRRDVRLIVGRRGADGSPTPPSRLLSSIRGDQLGRQIRRLLHQPIDRPPLWHRWDEGPPHTHFPIPVAQTSQPLTVISVTALKDYLSCPYRFYLRHVCRLRPQDDRGRELAANQFGDLIHDTLEAFAKSDDKDLHDQDRIARALKHHLRVTAAKKYGDNVNASVTLQIIQAEDRLKKVAAQQARRRGEGWVIRFAEHKLDEHTGGVLIVDEQPFGIRGRFDRIDQNEITGQWAILDYKTHGKKPESQHLQTIDHVTRWVDLQLPMYRELVPALGIDADPATVQLGYFNISDRESETKINVADFSSDLMSLAKQQIHDCIRGIRRGDFRPSENAVPFDDYAMIMQTGIRGQMRVIAGLDEPDEE